MAFDIYLALEADEQLQDLAADKGKAAVYKAVAKAIRLLAQDPHYPSLNSHHYSSLQGPNGEKVWESYAQNNTPSAWRIFWYFGPNKDEITILAITKHP